VSQVLEKGRIVELDAPAKLLANPKSKFGAMVAQTGTASAQHLQQAAVQALAKRVV
jgi:ABC-type proline/glycine betaine transport system ATPase subunit